jgi:adenylate cyclase
MSISHPAPSTPEGVLAASSSFVPEVEPILAADPVLAIVEWLSGNECHELDDAGLIAGLGRRLQAAGLPVDRFSLHLRAFHPEILGRTLAWAPNEPVEIHDRQHGVGTALTDDPLGQATEIREPLAVYRADRGDEAWTRIDVFQGRYLAELVAVRFHNADGPTSAAMFGTVRPAGFDAADRAALERIVPALRNACELRTLRQGELNLLDTYFGATTAQRILAGRIRRGQIESLDAALMLCDLRGFTDLSNRLPTERVLELLNLYFDQVLPAITDGGGEVLKFMGDAVMAFFHHDDAAEACRVALQAALAALDRLDRLAEPDARLRAGVALHYGKVSYGNIGSGHRLDFTVIGPDVNLVSRIQTVCANTGQPVLMSPRFVDLIGPERTTAIGFHTLKGFHEPMELHAPIGVQIRG